MHNRPSKVFGIGLSKTGTSSLNTALQILGYQSCHYPALDKLDEILKDYDAATDTPIACSFEELDSAYPGSKFILTIRETSSWLYSAEREFKGRHVVEPWKQEVRLRTYGVLEWDPSIFLTAYERHVQRVFNYFARRPNVLLVIDIISGEGWTPLCHFLGHQVPDVAFPWENRTDSCSYDVVANPPPLCRSRREPYLRELGL